MQAVELVSAIRSTNRLTSATPKKCRATSSIAPRQAKRGRSSIFPSAGATAVPSRRALDLGGEELPQRLHAVEEAGRARARHASRRPVRVQPVALVAERPSLGSSEDRDAVRGNGTRARRRAGGIRSPGAGCGEEIARPRQPRRPPRHDQGRRPKRERAGARAWRRAASESRAKGRRRRRGGAQVSGAFPPRRPRPRGLRRRAGRRPASRHRSTPHRARR